MTAPLPPTPAEIAAIARDVGLQLDAEASAARRCLRGRDGAPRRLPRQVPAHARGLEHPGEATLYGVAEVVEAAWGRA
jgi:hypothetical protein